MMKLRLALFSVPSSFGDSLEDSFQIIPGTVGLVDIASVFQRKKPIPTACPRYQKPE
jgi:hypothetical protein